MYFSGVVWQINHPIEGAFESLATLQKLGKKIYLVTNNTENSDKTYCDRAQCAGLHLNSVNMQYIFFSSLPVGLCDDHFICVYVYIKFMLIFLIESFSYYLFI